MIKSVPFFSKGSFLTQHGFMFMEDLEPYMNVIKDESICKRCGMCCHLAVKVEGQSYTIPSLH